MDKVQSIFWQEGVCRLLDQTQLPAHSVYLDCADYKSVVVAIKRLSVRGAPAIGVAGGFAVVLAHREAENHPVSDRDSWFRRALEEIHSSRPTAVNLRWAVDRMQVAWENELQCAFTPAANEQLLGLAEAIHREDVAANLAMAKFGASVLPKGGHALTYCNTGDLATSGGGGTALGVLEQAYRSGHLDGVITCETRPLLQGLRLTTWELQQKAIPFRAICDSMVASVMASGEVTSVVVGADRIASNGDAANKIGTFGVAILAKHFGIPFFVAAPTSTFDLSLSSGKEIPIEERGSEEIMGILGKNQPVEPFSVFNPAFDVAPAELISAIFCERGVIQPVSAEQVTKVVSR